MELIHCLNARIFYIELLKVLFDHGINDLVLVSIFSLEIFKVLCDHVINDLVFVICIPLYLPYLELELGYLLGLILLCLKNTPCLIEKLYCGELLNCKSRSRVILVTCWTLGSQWCCIRHIDVIRLGDGGLLILPRLCPPKLLLLLVRYHLPWFGWKGVSHSISYPSQRCK